MNRHRVFDKQDIEGLFSYLTYLDGVMMSSGTETQGIYPTEYSMDDVVTPNFKKLRANGVIVNNPMHSYKNTVIVGSGYRKAILKSNPGTWNQTAGNITSYYSSVDQVGRLVPSLLDHSVERQNAIVAAVSNIDKTPYSFGEDLAEIRGTLELMRHPFKSVLDVTDSLRSKYKKELRKQRIGKVRTFDATAKAAADSWLTYQFVYATTVRSLMTLHEAVVERPQLLPIRRTARGYYKKDSSVSDVINHPSGRSYARSAVNEILGRITILYEDTTPTDSWRDHLGLRFKDIPKTFWQIAPYSWVVDRFLNVSNSIGALTNLLDPSITVLMACDKTSENITDTLLFQSDVEPLWDITLSGNTITWFSTTNIRTPITVNVGSVIPRFDYKPAIASITSIADLSALSYNKLRKVFA